MRLKVIFSLNDNFDSVVVRVRVSDRIVPLRYVGKRVRKLRNMISRSHVNAVIAARLSIVLCNYLYDVY